MSLASVYLIGIASFSGFRGPFGAFLTNNWVVYFGKISYGLYVYHYILLYFFQSFAPTNSPLLNLFLSKFICLIATVLVSAISWEYFEKPINKLKKHFSYQTKIQVNELTALGK